MPWLGGIFRWPQDDNASKVFLHVFIGQDASGMVELENCNEKIPPGPLCQSGECHCGHDGGGICHVDPRAIRKEMGLVKGCDRDQWFVHHRLNGEF
jgi:hypothetical protein